MEIKEQIHGLTDEMLTNLGRLVAIDSQLGTPAEGMPFGEGPAKVLEEALKIADELGFKTVNLDNYCGYAEMGEGEEIVGIAGHLDIVPVGGDWTYDPFKLTREGDHVYGRGTTDDKGPVLEALYAMKLLRDSGVKLNKRVRLIMGCNEETGSKCMEHYNEVAEEVSCGFTPDANFPCIHGEKGMVMMTAHSKNTRIISMNGGFVSNAVPGCDQLHFTVPVRLFVKLPDLASCDYQNNRGICSFLIIFYYFFIGNSNRKLLYFSVYRKPYCLIHKPSLSGMTCHSLIPRIAPPLCGSRNLVTILYKDSSPSRR